MYQPKTAPFQHQAEALALSGDKVAYALLMEMGTGKTKVVLDNIGQLWHDGEIDGVLVLAPKGVYANWPNDEMPAHLPDSVLRASVVHLWRGGSSRREQQALEHLTSRAPGLHWLVMNIEALSASRLALPTAMQFLRQRRVFMVVDESTTIKSPSAARTKAAIRLGQQARYRRILTGAPVTNSPLDLWSQFQFLDPTILGFRSFFAFRNRYAVMEQMHMGARSVRVAVGYRNLGELSERIRPHSFRRLKDECLDLPPKVYERVNVELTADQQRMYRTLKEAAVAHLSTGEHVSAPAVITQLLRMHQLVCGYLVDEERQQHAVENNRLPAFMQLVEDLGPHERVVVWATYRRNIADIVAALQAAHGADSVVEYHGGVSLDAREEARRRFRDDPRCRFLVGNPQTAGRGLTLTSARVVVYYSNSHDLDHRLQSEDRTHRIGSEGHRSVLYIDLVCPGTVDERILRSLRAKINLAATITGDKLREWLEA